MEEETKTTKKTTTKKNTAKKSTTTKTTKPKTTAKKSTTTKKTSSVKKESSSVTSEKPVTTETKKAPAKKKTNTTNKVSEKKPGLKKAEVSSPTKKSPQKETIDTSKTPKETKEQILEHTIIFDGLEKENIADVVNNLEEETIVSEDKVIKRSKVRKLIIILLYILIIVIILTTAAYIINDQVGDKTSKETINSNIHGKVTNTYKNESDIKKKDEEVDKAPYSNIENIGLGKFEQIAFNKEDVHILVASSTCYYSTVYEEVINEVYKDNKDKIYRIDIHKLTSEEIEIFRNYYAFTATPTIFAIKEGVVTSELVGTTTNEELNDWYKENK